MSKVLITNLKNNYCYIEVDYMGNIYLKYNDDYYVLSLNADGLSGIEITKINSVDHLRETLRENHHYFKDIRRGKINSGRRTLSSLVHESFDSMTLVEQDEYTENNGYAPSDPHFIEKQFFWVKYDGDANTDDGFFLNGIIDETDSDSGRTTPHGITRSDMLITAICPFETILIEGDTDSKRVISYCERADGYCTDRLTIFTNGVFRANFTIQSKMCKLIIGDGGLSFQPF